ncbi:MAG: nucleotidyltransferase family protein [Thiothrix litoralis]|uniref:nucleotidyltransferase domain-containing protein n=1 Tax=Thiothrix litoralis TaxID=2891210 RepID=UPI003C78281C
MTEHFNTLCLLCSPNTTPDDLSDISIDWQAVWQLALRHRVVPVMADRIKQLNVAVPEAIAQPMAAHNQKNLLKGMKQSAELVFLLGILSEQHIPFVLFKGLATSNLSGLGLHQRHHGDIDILLANQQDIWNTDDILRRNGYERTHPPESIPLNDWQKRHLLKYGKDFGYFNKEKNIRLELHFKLFSSNVMCSLIESPADIYKNKINITINNHTIPIMNKQTHLIYLLIHGSISRWFRLKWLCDIPFISQNGDSYLNTNIIKTEKHSKLKSMIEQGLYLANKHLNMPISNHLIEKTTLEKNFIIDFSNQHLINQKTLAELRPKFSLELPLYYWKLMKYKLILIQSTRYRMEVFHAYTTEMDDWQMLQLPSTFAWLYYPLRPILWLKRQF